jgi:hypothetical protein
MTVFLADCVAASQACGLSGSGDGGKKKTAGFAGGLHRIRFSRACYERVPDSSRRGRKKPKK